MKNLRHQPGCHDCLHAMAVCDEHEGCLLYTLCLAGDQPPDTRGRTIERLRYLTKPEDKAQCAALAAWENAHTVELWDTCDLRVPERWLTTPVAYILETKSYHDIMDLGLVLYVPTNKAYGYVLDLRSRNLAEKVHQAVQDCEGVPVDGVYAVKLSKNGFAVLERTIQEVEKYYLKKDEQKRMARAKEVLAMFRKV